MTYPHSAIAFDGLEFIALGHLPDVVVSAKTALDRGAAGPVLLFDAETSAPVEVDFRGTIDEVLARLVSAEPVPTPRAPGRPKLGVVAREVTLLPAHWEWLGQQRGGASATIRRLVDAAARADSRGTIVRRARDVTYRFMSQLAGDLPHFEAATRALYAGDAVSFLNAVAGWPDGVRSHALRLSEEAFDHLTDTR